MTRLQNAEKQLADALAALESAFKTASSGGAPADSASSKHLAALVDEVSEIETKLGAAIAMVAEIDAAQIAAAQNTAAQNTAAQNTAAQNTAEASGKGDSE